jgi:hypothetical protein
VNENKKRTSPRALALILGAFVVFVVIFLVVNNGGPGGEIMKGTVARPATGN